MEPDEATTIRDAIQKSWSWWSERTNQSDVRAKALISFSIVCITILWLISMLKRSMKGKIQLPPGPWGLPLVGNLPFLDPELHVYYDKLAKLYGPVFKVKLGSKLSVVLSSPAMVKEALKDKGAIFADRDTPISAIAISYGGYDMAWAPYGPQWRMLHMVCIQEILSKTSLDELCALRQHEIRHTVTDVYSKIGTQINVGEQMFLTMLDVVTSMLWGGTLKSEERTSIGAEFREVVEEIVLLLGNANVPDFFPVIARFDLQGIERKQKQLLVWFDRIFDSIIDQRMKLDQAQEHGKSNCKENKNFLEVLLRHKDRSDLKMPFTMLHLKALLMDVVVAATDTTSSTIEWAMAETMKRPDIMTKAQNELENVVGRKNIVQESHLPKLRYLDAVLRETMRLHPAVPLLVPRCSRETCTVGGYTIPARTQVLVNAWGIQRDPTLWENPLDFQPERFLKEDSKIDFHGNDFSYVPFGSGRRVCVGISLAERMMPHVMASLLHSFEWEVPQGTDLDFKETFGIVLKKKTPLYAIPRPRLCNSELYY